MIVLNKYDENNWNMMIKEKLISTSSFRKPIILQPLSKMFHVKQRWVQMCVVDKKPSNTYPTPKRPKIIFPDIRFHVSHTKLLFCLENINLYLWNLCKSVRQGIHFL